MSSEFTVDFGRESELEPLSPHKVLYDALQATYSDLPEQQQAFQVAAEASLEETPPDQREAMMVGINMLRWQFFGEFGAPMPEGPRRVSAEDGVVVDHARISPNDINFCRNVMQRHGLERLTQKRDKQRAANKERLLGPLTEAIKQTDLYRALLALDIKDPADIKDRPFNAEEQARYDSKLQSELYRGYHLPPSESLRSEGDAFAEWKRGMGGLEVLTTEDRTEIPPTNMPIAALRGELISFIENGRYLKEEIDQQIKILKVTPLNEEHDANLTVRKCDEQGNETR